MIDINTLVAAYHFGNKISNTSFGRTLHLRYNGIKSNLSPETWSLYQDAIKTCSFQHYYSFGLAYKKVEAVCAEKEGNFQKSIIELQGCYELHSLIEEAEQLGRDLENSLLQMFVRLPSKNISGTFDSLDLYRAWMNVFYQLQSTKLLSYLHQHKLNIVNKQGNIQKFMESKEVYPFSRHNRILIRKLAIMVTDKDIMYSLELFDGLRNSILQVIFETHFNFLFRLNKNEIVDYREKERNKVRVFTTKVFGTEVFRYQGCFILLFENNTLQDIGLIKRRVGRNLEMGDKSFSTIEGLLYPKTDYNLFVPDLPN
ncbi:hypothetical protein [Schinkia azotoformans]|uniref:hypothetical protein n=1 Tax=Schinkia azotoformans TaxID=1454 RepID=UPI002DBAA7B2|nr:hypothetical protein [Schinkia azotoformans]MEC1719044.1 hypothetical protein [Schinkia azotoformans]MED4413907.1 hypothetical protein [Schinkia azotoformans]